MSKLFRVGNGWQIQIQIPKKKKGQYYSIYQSKKPAEVLTWNVWSQCHASLVLAYGGAFHVTRIALADFCPHSISKFRDPKDADNEPRLHFSPSRRLRRTNRVKMKYIHSNETLTVPEGGELLIFPQSQLIEALGAGGLGDGGGRRSPAGRSTLKKSTYWHIIGEQ